jgi:hypothetical protein
MCTAVTLVGPARQFLFASSSFVSKNFAHLWTTSYRDDEKYSNPYRQLNARGMQMRAWMVGIVVAIGLIWSVAAMSNLVPVDGSDAAAISRPAE